MYTDVHRSRGTLWKTSQWYEGQVDILSVLKTRKRLKQRHFPYDQHKNYNKRLQIGAIKMRLIVIYERI